VNQSTGLVVLVPIRIDFGVWGWCSDWELDEPNHSEDPIALEAFQPQCSPKRLQLNNTRDALQVAQIPSDGAVAKAISGPIGYGTVPLGVIACASCLWALFLSVLFIVEMEKSPERYNFRMAAKNTVVAAAATATLYSYVALATVTWVEIARGRLRSLPTDDVSLSVGNATWMMLGAAIPLWLATAVEHFRVRRAVLRERRRAGQLGEGVEALDVQDDDPDTHPLLSTGED